MERLTLRQPPDSFKRDSYGEYIKRPCTPDESADPAANNCILVDNPADASFNGRNDERYTDWTVYGRRTDRGGKQGIFADIMSGNWQTRFDIVRFLALDKLNEDWEITDVDGRKWDIETVNAGIQSGGRLMWQVYCVRRKAK